MSFIHARSVAMIVGTVTMLLAGCTSTAVEPTPTSPPTVTSTKEPTTVPTAVPSHTPSPSPSPTPTATATPAHLPGDTRIDSKGIEQVWVPAGSFLMGTGDTTGLQPPAWAAAELASEQPQHEVQITQGYWLDKYEVTNAAFQAFIEDGGYLKQEFWSDEGWQWLSRKIIDQLPARCTDDSEPDLPRVCITWYEAEAYARWRDGRLPTEAEWEFATRGPESLIYPWGNEFDRDKANVVGSNGLTAVGSYPDGVSWVGAHDMSGNAMEWVQNWLSFTYYEEGETVDPQGPATGSIKIEKGGWWGSNPFVARAAYHHFEDGPTYQDHHIGFRVLTPDGQE